MSSVNNSNIYCKRKQVHGVQMRGLVYSITEKTTSLTAFDNIIQQKRAHKNAPNYTQMYIHSPPRRVHPLVPRHIDS